MLRVLKDPSNSADQQDDKEVSSISNSLQTLMCKVSKSVDTLSLMDTLIANLSQLTLNDHEKLTLKDEDFLRLLESVDNLQSLSFLLNNKMSSQIVVDNLSAPDGNMSNKYVDCLLNWYLEINYFR